MTHETATLHDCFYLIIGLEGGPTYLADTMKPDTSPEVAAEAKVLVDGGFDPWFVSGLFATQFN